MPGRAKFRNHDFQISQNFSFWQVFENYNIIWCFYFWRVLLVITAPSPLPPPFKNIQLFSPIYTYPSIDFRKIDMTSKNYWGFIRFPPTTLFRGEEGSWCHDNAWYILLCSSDIEILGWCPAGTVLPHGEKVPF